MSLQLNAAIISFFASLEVHSTKCTLARLLLAIPSLSNFNLVEAARVALDEACVDKVNRDLVRRRVEVYNRRDHRP